MANNSRNTRAQQKLARQRQIKMRMIFTAAVAVLVLIILIGALKQGNLKKGSEKTGKETTETADAGSKKDNKNKDTTQEDTTEEITTEEETTQAQFVGDFIPYVNYENPDTSSRGDDYFNPDKFVPANVTDDAYFDTALIIGDSRTEGLSLYSAPSNLDFIATKGLSIDAVLEENIATTSDGAECTVKEYLQTKHYDNIYISFGLNELGWYYYEVFIDNYKEVISMIKEAQPDATIYVENVLPVSAALSEIDNVYNNPNVDKINSMTKEMVQSYDDVIYLDVASSVAVNGVLPADASSDGRHCTAEYTDKWMDYIRKNVYVKKQ